MMSGRARSTYEPLRLRVALGLGDQDLEQRLRPALEASDELQVVAQCLTADRLVQVADSGQADAIVAAWSLHRLSHAVLDQLARPGLVVVLLVPDPADGRWQAHRGPVLDITADSATVRQALMSAGHGARPVMAAESAHSWPAVPLKPADGADDGSLGSVVAVTGGLGSPGRTTVAISLAAALGAVAPTVLVELDLCASAVAAYLDLDPTRNLCTLAHSVGDGARNWSVALGEELQPLQAAEPAAAQVLCGPPKREMRSTITPRMVDKLVGELARGNRWVILDVGPELQGLDVTPAAHRSALARADHLLVVSGSDLVSLWHARTLLDQFENLLEIERERVNLVLNRHDGRFHHSRDEIEWHLGAPVVGVVPFDQPAIQRAIADQRPVVVDRSSRAGRALQSLADRIIAAEKLRTGSPVAKQARGPWWQRLLIRRPRPTTWAPALRGQPLAALGSRRTGP